MARQLPLHAMLLISIFLCSVLYGVYLITCGWCIYSLLKRRTANIVRRRKWEYVAASIATLILTSLKIALLLTSSIKAFVLYRGSGGPSEGIVASRTATFLFIQARHVLNLAHWHALDETTPIGIYHTNNSYYRRCSAGLVFEFLSTIVWTY